MWVWREVPKLSRDGATAALHLSLAKGLSCAHSPDVLWSALDTSGPRGRVCKRIQIIVPFSQKQYTTLLQS